MALPTGAFPAALPFAWLLMAGAAVLSLPEAHPPRVRFQPFGLLFRPILGGLLAAAVDLAMEPVLAGPLHYWRWIERGPLPGGAPIANSLGWWATGTVAGLILTVKAPHVDPRAPRWVLGGFLTLILGLGLVS